MGYISVVESLRISSTTFMQCAAKAIEFAEIAQTITTITPFKVIQGHRFWYRSKAHIYDFLWVINSNLSPVLHRFRDIAFDRSKIVIFGYPCCVEWRRWSSSLHHIMVSDTSLKTRNYGLYFCRRKFTYIFNHFYAVRRESYRICWNSTN